MLFLATALATAACAEAPPEEGSPLGAGGKADGALTTLTFDAGWNETADGPLAAGSAIRVDYDLARLTTCRGSTGGSEVWGVTGFVSFDGGEPRSFPVSRLDGGRVVPVAAELELPATAKGAAFWFQINNRWGCVAYDSNLDANYRFELGRPERTSVLAFEADFSETQSDAIRAGDQVIVHYAPERLATCAGSSGGRAVWGVTAHWRVDGGAVRSLPVARAEGAELVASDPAISIPRGAELQLWFEATNIWGCHAYDSDLGANYRARIEP
jgi:uncharacterized protein YraI